MRPRILFPLFAELASLPGIGRRRMHQFARLGITRVKDLLFHQPKDVVDRRLRTGPLAAHLGEDGAFALQVLRHEPAPAGTRRPYRVVTRAAEGERVDIVFFHADRAQVSSRLPVGSERVVCGRLEQFGARLQIVHPELVLPPERAAGLPPFAPVYGATEGLGQLVIREAVSVALARLPRLPEWIRQDILAREGWPGFSEALTTVHRPASADALAPMDPARRRLAYDELLADQLALALTRRQFRHEAGLARRFAGTLREKIVAALPFPLTGDQQKALAEIETDLQAETAMLRLLQGDVGSGKTIVALLAAADVIESGAQAALMAPTEILARQHMATAERLLAPHGIRIALLTGRQTAAERRRLLAALAAGEVDLVIGTHALIEDPVRFGDLGLVIIDEQHRFGVAQRLKLAEKGRHRPDMLVMTATPIPRTLMLAAFGDMDASRIVEKPPGRQRVDTRVVSLARLEEVVAALERALAGGERAYWICPLVAESEASDLAAAEERFAMLKERLGDTVALLHGRMKGAEKDAAMAAFADGRCRLLVATTVVEVGVDVPEANIIVIEHAERFGLAQLHQLRGRVGRGGGRPRCLLLRAEDLSATQRERLDVLRRTDDGFAIAEADLKLRGGGELLGTRQTGLPDYRLADLAAHADLLALAHRDARLVVEQDPDLAGPRGRALRILLHLFEKDEAARYLTGG
ncbi:MAG: ATP-dependent DNA helicase RecG [Alphaproteobacteria bacterium]|nr:MAG: ATP-dependent DNA helicase RecG [Alphaproteobacteria bacterium]